MSWALLVAGTALAISAAPAIPAAAAASGSETLSGTIVFTATGLATRTVLGSAVRARGAFKGVGRVVEVVYAGAVSQDNLVFPGGTLHVGQHARESRVTLCYQPAQLPVHRDIGAHLDPTGGTGKFTGAAGSFTGTVSARAQLARNPDGTCSTERLPLHEVDKFAESGTLSF